jgi:hypothetical protein
MSAQVELDSSFADKVQGTFSVRPVFSGAAHTWEFQTTKVLLFPAIPVFVSRVSPVDYPFTVFHRGIHDSRQWRRA